MQERFATGKIDKSDAKCFCLFKVSDHIVKISVTILAPLLPDVTKRTTAITAIGDVIMKKNGRWKIHGVQIAVDFSFILNWILTVCYVALNNFFPSIPHDDQT